MKSIAIILAGGNGQRFGSEVPKQFIKINKKMIIEYTLDVFQKCPDVDEIVVVTAKEFINTLENLKGNYPKMVKIVTGGETRLESCLNAVHTLEDIQAKVLIHNAVQPCLSAEKITECIRKLDEYDCVTLGLPSVYTVLELDEHHLVKNICLRNSSYLDFGPECFKLTLLKQIFTNYTQNAGYTNFTAFVNAHHLAPIFVVESNRENIKLTFPEDLYLIHNLLNKK